MPDHPACPICQWKEANLIAIVKDERTVEIYLCQHCGRHFSYERATGKVNTDVQPA